MDKISIIIPVYNVEKYLEKCLESVVNQTYKNLEIIIVNDGTKDNSQNIIDKFAKRYPEIIKPYIKENGGLSDARNYAIERATGKYITFIDSDDYIAKDMIEKLYNKIREKNFDISVCDSIYEYPNKNVIVCSNLKQDIEKKEDIRRAMNILYPSAWGKLYKKELFENLRYKKGIWFEDVELIFRMYPKINKIGVVNEPLYYYIQRPDSITYTYNEKLNDCIRNWNGILEYYKENKLYEEYKEELEYSYVRYIYGTYVKRLAKTKDKQIFNKGIRMAIAEVNDKFPDYKTNKYINEKNAKNMYLKHFNKVLAKLIFCTEKNKMN